MTDVCKYWYRNKEASLTRTEKVECSIKVVLVVVGQDWRVLVSDLLIGTEND